jgi:molybdate transport repressor ModE-like protein
MENWLGVEPRHLAALVAVHREGSFRGAATSLGYAQSAVSQRVAQLEKLVGMRMVERSRGHATVKLTEAGTRLVDHADSILAELDAALADLRGFAGRPAMTLHVGAYESVASRLLPGALKRLTEESPGTRVFLREDPDWGQFFPLVANGVLDAAFADLPLHPGPFAFRELVRDPCMFVVPADSPLANRPEPPTLEEIGSLPLIIGSWPMLGLITEHLRAAGVEPQWVFRSDMNDGAQSLVAAGVGATLMPRLSIDETDPRIAAISLEGTLPSRRICMYWHRERKDDEGIQLLLTALEAGEAVEA